MKNLCKGLLIAMVAVGCGLIAVPKASADTIITTTNPGVIDYSNPVVLSQPAVINTMPVDTTLMAPSVITEPSVVAPVYDSPHLLDFGLGNLLNFSLF